MGSSIFMREFTIIGFSLKFNKINTFGLDVHVCYDVGSTCFDSVNTAEENFTF